MLMQEEKRVLLVCFFRGEGVIKLIWSGAIWEGLQFLGSKR